MNNDKNINLHRVEDCSATTCSLVDFLDKVKVNESLFVADPSGKKIPVLWLAALWTSPKLVSSQDQIRWIPRYELPKHIYDNLYVNHLLEKMEEKLRKIYPDSFLFQLPPEQIRVIEGTPLPVSLEHLVEICQQTLSFRSEDLIGGERILAELVHTSSLKIQMPKPHSSSFVAASVYDQHRQSYGDTWLW